MEIKKKWYEILEDRFNEIMSRHDMPEDIAVELHNFVLGVARDQFKSGNHSGIIWVRKQIALEKKALALGAA